MLTAAAMRIRAGFDSGMRAAAECRYAIECAYFRADADIADAAADALLSFDFCRRCHAFDAAAFRHAAEQYAAAF